MSPGWISGAPVLLLVGGGHNGADTLLAGGLLSHSGCAVTAVLATEHPHPVALEEARSHGVTVYGAGYRSDGAEDWDSAEAVAAVEAFLARGGLVLDGLTGIGATGPLRPDAVARCASSPSTCPAEPASMTAPSMVRFSPPTARSPSPASRGACVCPRPGTCAVPSRSSPSGCPRPRAVPSPAAPSTARWATT